MTDQSIQPTISLGVGDSVAIGTVLANLHLMGVVTDPTTPNMFAATLEVFGDQGLLAIPVLQGPPGPAGQPQFALRFQNDNTTDPSNLPTDLTNTDADIGKYWIFKQYDSNGNVSGTTMYVWYGTEYHQMPVGSTGPPGPYPLITPFVNLIDADLTSYVSVSGPTSNPEWTLNLAVPAGPPGPASALALCPDVDLTTPPSIGQVLGFNGKYNDIGAPVFQMMNVGDILPMPYTIPESAFQSYSGISANRQTVCTWDCPKQQWPWKPWVSGQLEVSGFEFSSTKMYGNILLIGAEVRLNDPKTGPLVARGFGNSSGSVTLIPHTSDPNNPSVAMTPENSYALVQAGTPAKLYVNLYNDGMAAAYDFDPRNAQINMLALPIGTIKALPIAYFGTFGGRGKLQATWKFAPAGS